MKRIGALLAVLALSACGGSGDGAAPTTQSKPAAAAVTAEELSKDWVRIGSKLLVRLERDGAFAMDYENGDLDRPTTAQGTYELSGNRVTFTNEGPGFCPVGGTWAWEVRVVEEVLHVEWVDGGCTIETGTLWRLTPRLVQP